MPDTLDRPANRLHFLDNLRSFLIFLVVLLHTGLVYESSGAVAFFWIVDDPATNDLAGIVNLVCDIFVMAALFFVSGYLAPASLERKGAAGFLGSRFRRLLVPWVLAVFTLVPLYKVIFLASRGLPQESWTTYFHFSNGIWGQNWLWFLPVLFLISAAYVLLAKLRWTPTKLSLGLAVTAACVVGFVNTFGLERLGLHGWTKTWLLDFQNERLLVYLLAFLIGSLCFHKRVFADEPRGKRLFILAAATAWLPMNVYLLFLLAPWIKPGTVFITPMLDRAVLWASFYASLVALLYLSIQTFRRYLDRSGPLWRELGRNSYSVYVLHVVVIGVMATLFLTAAMPSLQKYLLVTVASFLVSNLVASLVRRLSLGAPARGLEARPAQST